MPPRPHPLPSAAAPPQEVGARVMDAACFCPRARARGINAIIKRVDLGAAGISCAEFCK